MPYPWSCVSHAVCALGVASEFGDLHGRTGVAGVGMGGSISLAIAIALVAPRLLGGREKCIEREMHAGKS